MSLLAEVGMHLASLGLGTVATSIFLGHMPDAPSVCCSLHEYGGAPAELGFGVAGVQFEHPGLQVRFRGEPRDYEAPRANAESAYRGLAAVQAQTLGSPGTYYHLVVPQQSPYLLERDGQERCVIACNFLVTKVPS